MSVYSVHTWSNNDESPKIEPKPFICTETLQFMFRHDGVQKGTITRLQITVPRSLKIQF